jgi:ubiquinone/menaquinone biosynthesis C-methylase UbiE
MFDLFKFKLRQFKSNAWKSKTKAYVYEKQTNSTGDYQDFLTRDYILELTKRINDDATVLDLGCGTGVLSMQLGEMGYTVFSLDISKGMLEQLAIKKENLPIQLFEGDIFELPFENEIFEGIITRWVLPHFSDWHLAVNESSRVLKKGGIFIFDITSEENYSVVGAEKMLNFDTFGYNPYNKNAKNYYAASTKEKILNITKLAGLEVLEIIPNGFYRSNAIFATCLSDDEYKNFKNEFNIYYKNEEVKQFIQWFDLNVVKKLPLYLSNTLTVVTRKK